MSNSQLHLPIRSTAPEAVLLAAKLSGVHLLRVASEQPEACPSWQRRMLSAR